MKGPSLAVKGAILLVGVWVFLIYGLPLFTAPLPMSLTWLYIILAEYAGSGHQPRVWE
jgi:hypothetical protein